jgi:hypothetical protein
MHKSKRNQKYRKNKKDRKLSKKVVGGLSFPSFFKKNDTNSNSTDNKVVSNVSIRQNPMIDLPIAEQINTNSVTNLGNEKNVNTTTINTKEDQNLLNKHKSALELLKTIDTKNGLNITLMINCCVLYNVYIAVDKTKNEDNTIQLYKEELIKIGIELDGIFNKIRELLNDFYITNCFGGPSYLFDTNKNKENNINDVIDELIKAPTEKVELLEMDKTPVNVVTNDVENKNIEDVKKTMDNMFENLETGNQDESGTGTGNKDETGKSIGGNADVPNDDDDNDDTTDTSDANDSLPLVFNKEFKNKLFDEFFNNIKHINIKYGEHFKLETINNTPNSNRYLINTYLFIYKIRNLYNEALMSIGETDEKGKKTMAEARTVLAKTQMINALKLWGGSTNRTCKKLKGGEFNFRSKFRNTSKTFGNTISKTISKTYDTGKNLATMTSSFFSKRDPKIKEKYTYIHYFMSFLETYVRNVLTKTTLKSEFREEDIVNANSKYKGALVKSYNLAYKTLSYAGQLVWKNPLLGTTFILLSLSANFATYASPVFPVLIPIALGLTMTRNVYAVATLPLIDAPAVELFKRSEIEAYNKNMMKLIGSEFTKKRLTQIKKIENYLLGEVENTRYNKFMNKKPSAHSYLDDTQKADIRKFITEENNLIENNKIPIVVDEQARDKINKKDNKAVEINELRYNKIKYLQKLLNGIQIPDEKIVKYRNRINHFVNKYNYQKSLNDLIFGYQDFIISYILTKKIEYNYKLLTDKTQ